MDKDYSLEEGYVWGMCNLLVINTGFIITSDASMSLNKIKEKQTQIFKEYMNKAEEREAEAKSPLKEAKAQEEKHATEAEEIKRRMRLLQTDLDKVNKRLQEKKLEQVTQKGEKEELFRNELEENEEGGDEKISELESLINEIAKDGEEKHHTLTEAK